MFPRTLWRVLLVVSLSLMISAAPGAALPVRAGAPEGMAESPLLASTQFFVSQVVMSPTSPNILPFGQNISFTFNYDITYPAGVRIFTRPFTNGALTPNYAASGSLIYPTGTGSASGSFTITSGEVVVDRVRIRIVAADTDAVLEDYFLPVHYQFSGAADLPHNIILTPQTPNILKNGQDVTVDFSYKSSYPGGVRIFTRPMTGDALTPGYAASGSDLYSGTGSSFDFFRINSGTPMVDQIRFEVTNADQTILLENFYLPVSYQVTDSDTFVTDILLTPPAANPNILDNNQDVTLTFNYTTNHPGGVRIFARPFSHGALSPGYAASGSILYPTGSGSGSSNFTIAVGTVLVDGIRIQVVNSDQTILLYEEVIPVYYLFGGNFYWTYAPHIVR